MLCEPLACFARVLTCFDLRACPFPIVEVEFALQAPGVFCMGAHVFFTSVPVLFLKKRWSLLCEPLACFARVLTYFDLRACPFIFRRDGVCYVQNGVPSGDLSKRVSFGANLFT
jgi:hypothetical protein